MRTLFIYGTDIHGPESWWNDYAWVERPIDPVWSMTDRASMDGLMSGAAELARIDGLAILLRGAADGGFKTSALKASIEEYAGATSPTLCPFVDTGALSAITGYDAPEVPFDFANPQHIDWFWTRLLEPFYLQFQEGRPARHPIRYERTQAGGLLVILWSINPSGAGIINQAHAQTLLDATTDRMVAAGLGSPSFVVDQSWLKYAPNLRVYGVHDWFNAAARTSWSCRTHNGVTVGVAVPGFHVASQPTWIIPRAGGDTLRAGLAAIRARAPVEYVILEGLTDVSESAGYYESDAWTPRTLYYDIVRAHVQANQPDVGPVPTPIPPGGHVIGATLNGKYIGCEPGTMAVYWDRPALLAWEEGRIVKRGAYWDFILNASEVLVCCNQGTHKLEGRTPGDTGWGSQWIYDDVKKTLTIPSPGAPVLAVVGNVPLPVELTRLRIDNWRFINEAGHVIDWAHTSGFRDLDRLLRGQVPQVRDVLAQSKDQGATGRRVFAMKWNWAIKVNGVWQDGPDHTWPNEHANYDQRVGELAALYQEYGQYLNLVVFVNARSVMPDINEQLRFWDRMVAIAGTYPNIILSLVNENNAHDNAVDIPRFPQPSGILASTGSNGAGANPPTPFWSGPYGYSELHPERRAERASLGTTTLHFAIWGYEEGGDSWPGTRWQTVASEPYGFDEENEPGRRTNDPAIAWLLGLGCNWGSGGTGLAADGIESVLLRPKQDACMRAFVAAVKAGRKP